MVLPSKMYKKRTDFIHQSILFILGPFNFGEFFDKKLTELRNNLVSSQKKFKQIMGKDTWCAFDDEELTKELSEIGSDLL